MFTYLILALLVRHSEQHLTYPINYCNMATTCIHDAKEICASSSDGCTRRTFIDQCDMYEYNCDYNTRYQETYKIFCIGYTLKFTTQPETNKITNHCGNENCLTTTRFITTSMVTERLDKNETIDITTFRTPTVTASKNTKENTSFTKSITEIICCDRPKTWETSTGNFKTIPYSLLPDEITKTNTDSNTINTNDKTDIMTKTTQITFEPSTVTELTDAKTKYFTTETIPPSTELLTTNSTQQSLITENDVIFTVSEKPAKNTPSCNVHNCNVPVTWETTTENIHTWLVSDVDEETTQIDTTTTTTTTPPVKETIYPYNKTISITNDEPTELPVTNITTKPTTPQTTKTTQSTLTTPFKQPNLSTQTMETQKTKSSMKTQIEINSTPAEIIKLTEKRPTKYSVTYCKMKKCQRPITWITTTRRRRKMIMSV